MTASDRPAPDDALDPRCPLCHGSTEPFADGTVLRDRPVRYVRCRACGSVALPDPDWLDEAYSSAISALDVGLLERCLQLANVTGALVSAQRLTGGRFLDFAGGYGTLTRLLRDRGHDFWHHDPLCGNVFAAGFEGGVDDRYDLVTCYEVLEHLPDPVTQLAEVAGSTDLLLLTTQVLPEPAPMPEGWDYYAPQTGQHVTFATVAGLEALASELGFTCTTGGRLVHLFHRRPLTPAARWLVRHERLAYLAGAGAAEVGRRRGLLQPDARTAAARLLAAAPAAPRAAGPRV